MVDFAFAGQMYTKKYAAKKLTGTAIIMAIKEVVNVPTIGIKAPNCSLPGCHALLHKKLIPYFDKLGNDSLTRAAMMPNNSKNTKIAVAYTINVKTLSAVLPDDCRLFVVICEKLQISRLVNCKLRPTAN